MTLSQRRGTERRSFAIDHDALEVEETTLFSRMSYRVPFEAIPDDSFTIASWSRMWFGLTMAALAAIFAHPAAAVAAVLCALLFHRSRRAYVGLRCGRQVVLFLD